jgi:hypothetical protein
MAKLTLTDLNGGYGSVSDLNTNFASIESEFQSKVLYRDNPIGEPNQMENDLDMNSNDILNVSEVDTANLRLNGSLVTFGTNAIENTFQDTEFTSSAGETVFTVDYTPGFLIALINGVELADADFTATNGTSVTLASAVADDSDIITFRAFGSFNVADALAVSNNLSDVASASTARTNLDVYSTSEVNNIVESHAELGTATFLSDVYTFTPVSGVFNTLTSGMVISFPLPASSTNTTTTPAIDYNGTQYTMKYIDGSAFAVGDIDVTYNKQNLSWRFDGTDLLLISDLSGQSWIKYSSGYMEVNSNLPAAAATGWTVATNHAYINGGTESFSKTFSNLRDITWNITDGQISGRSAYITNLTTNNSGITACWYATPVLAASFGSGVGGSYTASGRWY